MHLNAKETLELMLTHLELNAMVQEEERSEGVALNILIEEPGWLIDDDNQVLDELQYLLNRVMLSEESDQPKIIVDVNNRRKIQQQEFLKGVIEAAETVRQSGEEMILPPMNSFERMLVHNHFKNDSEIETTSPEGPDRIKQITVRRTSN